ncbi:MAG: hypothetical protein IPO22_23570 [Anaerolineales bacterium]|nr:hypothetical protein [Anaerolineales bacterium]
MFAYYLDNEIWKFSGWNEYVVDQNGQLVVSLLFDGLGSDTDIPALIAVGEKSGEAPLLTTRSSGGRITWAHEKISVGGSESQSKYMQCSSEQLSSSNLMSRYNAQAVDSVKIYVNPRLDARTFNEVPANSKVYVFLGPYCTGNQVWWKADAEVGAGYLLEKTTVTILSRFICLPIFVVDCSQSSQLVIG